MIIRQRREVKKGDLAARLVAALLVLMALATRLAQGPTFSMSLIKMLVHKAQQQDLAEHLAQAARAQHLARQTADHKEGVQAFLEKRKPNFIGR